MFVSTEKSQLESPLEENVNRIIPEEGAVDARSIEDAIAVLRYRILKRHNLSMLPPTKAMLKLL